jgi:beta-mannosidase
LFKEEGESQKREYGESRYKNGNAYCSKHYNAGMEKASLSFNEGTYFKDHFVKSIGEDLNNPLFQFVVDIKNGYSDDLEVEFELPEFGLQFKQKHALGDSVTFISFNIPVSRENLWMPEEKGEAKLFDAKIKLWNGRTLVDEDKFLLGFSDHQWIPKENKFVYHINNRKLDLKAIELSPANVYTPNGDKNFWREKVKGLLDLDINCIKLSGDNFYAPEDLLDVCDSMGMLVWQDFNLHRPMLYLSPGDKIEISKMLFEQIYNLRRHPSIIALGSSDMNSDTLQMHQGITEKEVKEILEENRNLFERLMGKLVLAGSGLAYFPNSDSFWNVRDDQKIASMSDYTYLDIWLSENEKYPYSESWSDHAPTGMNIEKYYEDVISKYSEPLDLEALIYYTELYQLENLLEVIKKGEGEDKLLLPLSYNEPMPGIHANVENYFGSKNAAYYALKEEVDAFVFRLDRQSNNVSVTLKNQSDHALHGKIITRLLDITGKEVDQSAAPVQMSQGNQGLVFVKNYGSDIANHILVVHYEEDDEVLFQKVFDFVPFKNPELPLPSPAFRVLNEAGSSYLEIFSESYMKMVKLSSSHLGYFDENYFNLLPNDTLKIPFISEDTSYPLSSGEVSVYSYYQTYE